MEGNMFQGLGHGYLYIILSTTLSLSEFCFIESPLFSAPSVFPSLLDLSYQPQACLNISYLKKYSPVHFPTLLPHCSHPSPRQTLWNWTYTFVSTSLPPIHPSKHCSAISLPAIPPELFFLRLVINISIIVIFKWHFFNLYLMWLLCSIGHYWLHSCHSFLS